MTEPESAPASSPLAIAPFRAMWGAGVSGMFGHFFFVVASSWLMLELTGSPLWVGLMVAAPRLPMLFLGLPAGALADSVDRRRVVICGHAVMASAALLTAGLHAIGLLGPTLLLGFGLLLGAGHALNTPAMQALVSDLVPPHLVPTAVTMNSAGNNAARAIGPAVGGVIVATAGPRYAFLLTGLLYLVMQIAVRRVDRAAVAEAGSSMRHAIALGLRYTRYTPDLRRLMLVAAGFALTGSVVQAVLPNLSRDHLAGGAGLYGALLGAMGVGALVGAVTRRRAADRVGGRLVPLAMAGFGLTGLFIAAVRVPGATAAAMAVQGLLWVWILSTMNATVQLLAPRWVRGRVMSVYTLAFVGLVPISAALSGLIADLFGVPGAIAAISVAGVTLGLVSLTSPLPDLRGVVTPEPLEHVDRSRHPDHVKGDRVVIVTRWRIAEEDFAAFLEVMSELRIVRLKTGASRWALYREAGDPSDISERFTLGSWEEHLRQHQRLDTEAADVIQRARAFDTGGGPTTSHLVRIDGVGADEQPSWEELLAVHDDYHERDGSVPLQRGSAGPTATSADRKG